MGWTVWKMMIITLIIITPGDSLRIALHVASIHALGQKPAQQYNHTHKYTHSSDDILGASLGVKFEKKTHIFALPPHCIVALILKYKYISTIIVISVMLLITINTHVTIAS